MGVLENSLHVPLPELKTRMDEVLEFINKHEDADLVVHCKTGVRARVAASILHNHVVQPVTVLNEILALIS
jgi:rhodanese-related sulfurtransferase